MSEAQLLTLWREGILNEREGRVLRTPCAEVSLPLDGEDKRDAETLIFSFLKMNEALGLAAPQIGIPKRIIVFRIRGFNEKNWTKDPRDFEVLVNPRIVQARGDLETDTEGCLSCPEIQAAVSRWPEIKVRAFDRSGKKLNRRYQGFLARIVQHEMDHLEGRLIIEAGETIHYPRKYEQLFKSLLLGK